jgi:hypothetical protein
VRRARRASQGVVSGHSSARQSALTAVSEGFDICGQLTRWRAGTLVSEANNRPIWRDQFGEFARVVCEGLYSGLCAD